MFTTLFSVYQNLNRPSSLLFVNIWAYSAMNSWVFLSNELLAFYITSVSGFNTITTTTYQLFPQLLFKVTFVLILCVQLSLLLG